MPQAFSLQGRERNFCEENKKVRGGCLGLSYVLD